MPELSMKRVFLVGCPRSGTTLLQSLLASHSQVMSFPESHFFTRVISSRYLLRRCGVASTRARRQFKVFLNIIGHDDMRSYLPWFAVFARQYANAFTDILDHLTRQQNKQIWLEKTPRHLHYIDEIATLVPQARFIHLIRNGADVIASLYEAVNARADIWSSMTTGDIDQFIERWIQSIRLSQAHADAPNHIIVRYEHLVENPIAILKQLCRFMQIPFESHILENFRDHAPTLILPHETWKQMVTHPIENVNQKKFYRLFDETQRRYINKKISHIDLDELACLAVT